MSVSPVSTIWIARMAASATWLFPAFPDRYVRAGIGCLSGDFPVPVPVPVGVRIPIRRRKRDACLRGALLEIVDDAEKRVPSDRVVLAMAANQCLVSLTEVQPQAPPNTFEALFAEA